MIKFLLIPLLSILARQSGGGLGAHILGKREEGKKGIMPVSLTWLPEFLLGATVGAVLYMQGLAWHLAIAAALWVYFWMERGHGTVYKMRGWESKDPNRKDGVEILMRPVFNLLGWSIYTQRYSWACMGFKGFMMGLPLFPFGLLLAFLWPASYAFKKGDTRLGEYLSGASLGLCAVLQIFLWG